MENFFLNRFKDKSEQELRKIIDNKEGFQNEAVNAAIQLLNERNNSEIQKLENFKERISDKESDSGLLSYSFGLKPFFRTLSYRDFLTSFSLALFFLAYSEILDYYSDERILENTYKMLQSIGAIVLMLINHILYKIEHNRSNNFIGRSIHDVIFIIMFFAGRVSYSFILDSSYSISFEGNIAAIFFILIGFAILIFMFESMVALIKRILRLFKWQIF